MPANSVRRPNILPAALAVAALVLYVAASIISPPQSLHVSLIEGTDARLGPVTLYLDSFRIERDGDGAAKDYVSEIVVHGPEGSARRTVRVGRPAVCGGWRFYQSDFGGTGGPEACSTLLCVRDSLVPAKAAGLWMLLCAGLLMIALAAALRPSRGGGAARWAVPLCVIFALVFTWTVLRGVGVGGRSLPPVLRSPWFAPHLAAYMLGYAAMATAAVLGFVSLRREQVRGALRTAVLIGFGLLTCGLALGALWAGQAWGSFWSWDPKETWALATWLAYAVYLHLPRRRWTVAVLAIAFLLLQMCWWGVTLLPSAASSMHIYN